LVDGSPAADGGGDGAAEEDSGADGSAGSDGSPDSGGGGDAGAPTVPGTWVLIDVSGTPFTMGSPVTELGRQTNEVEHAVTLTRNYWLMTTEITQQQYLDEMGYNPSHFSSGGAGADCGLDCPVEYVNWHEVAAYANALSALEGLGECYSCTGTAPATIDCAPNGSYATPYDCPGYRLPTEAEWEYAARGGDGRATYNGNLDDTNGTFDPATCDANPELEAIAWWCGAVGMNSTTHPVAGKMANGYGLYDMLGNVYEWCHDWYPVYPGGAETDPAGPASGSGRVRRGGSWRGFARDARAAHRVNNTPGFRISIIGGRILRSSP
jgi:formylglycine-generating enzyme required for sulfatase activity